MMLNPQILLISLVVASSLQGAIATYGLDVSTSVSTSQFKCLRGDGFDFAVVRAYESVGRPGTVAAAWAGGMAHVDVYMFPCPTCGNPKGQVQDAIQYLRNHNTKYGMFWFDIEGPQYWTNSVSNNVQIMRDMLDEANAQGVKIGIYTSASQWNPIMGGSTIGSSYPLWYAHYDGSASFGDFQPFGGWSKPSIKQYAGTTSACGAGIDKDWYP